MKQGVQKQLQEKVDAKKLNVQIHASQLHTDPNSHLYKKNKNRCSIRATVFIIVLSSPLREVISFEVVLF